MCLLVVATTFPLALPFLLMEQVGPAMRASNAIALAMLFLTGVVQAPITSFVIASEMTENHALVIPLMLTALTAQAAARLVCRRGLYHDLAHTLLRRRGVARQAQDHSPG